MNERIADYIASLSPRLPDYLEELRDQCESEQVPVIRRASEPLIAFLLSLHKPKRLLEVGTAIGYSALFMSKYGPTGMHIDTIERSEKWGAIARDNFLKHFEDKPSAEENPPLSKKEKSSSEENPPLSKKEKPSSEENPPLSKKDKLSAKENHHIRLLEGDASVILPGLSPYYDMIFMDAAKGQYLEFLSQIKRLIKKGGILLSDNVFQDGDIIKPRSMVTRRDRTIHSRMREYLYELTHSKDWQSVILDIGDGMAVSVYLGEDDGKE